jgi:hypothetical protein
MVDIGLGLVLFTHEQFLPDRGLDGYSVWTLNPAAGTCRDMHEWEREEVRGHGSTLKRGRPLHILDALLKGGHHFTKYPLPPTSVNTYTCVCICSYLFEEINHCAVQLRALILFTFHAGPN